MVTTASQLH